MTRKLLRRALRFVMWAALAILAGAATYALAAFVLGLAPANAEWTPPASGIRIFVRSNGVHTDFVVPARTAAADWTTFTPPPTGLAAEAVTHVAFGWGDREFYLKTPTWGDLTLSSAANAVLVPSVTVMHVTHYYRPPAETDRCLKLVVRRAEYERLVEYIRESFERDEEGRPRPIAGVAYHDHDTFYEATGAYHMFNTCNDWTNSGLKAMGVRTAVWSPFDHAILRQLGRE